MGHNNVVWNVVRSEFDHLLLDHASSLGVNVYQNTKVVSLTLDQNNKPVSAVYTCRSPEIGNAANGVITFNYLVDATGRAGLMSTKYLNNRNFTESLKNIAVWGYWTGAGSYGQGTTRAGAPWFEALTGIDFISEPILVACKLTPTLQANPGGRGSYLCILGSPPSELLSIKKSMPDVPDRSPMGLREARPRKMRPMGRQPSTPYSEPWVHTSQFFRKFHDRSHLMSRHLPNDIWTPWNWPWA